MVHKTTLTEEDLIIESTIEPIADGITEVTGLEKVALEAIEIEITISLHK